MLRTISWRDYVGCFTSALLLILSFPKTDWYGLTWIALVPLFFVLDKQSPKRAFKLAYLCGLIFFTGTLYWIGIVTKVGTSLLMLYMSLYFGFFAWGYVYAQKRSLLFQWLFLPALWTSLEFARAHLFSGFAWSSLCLSQYKNTVMIQMVDITGMFGVSFLIVMVNLVVKEFVTIVLKKQKVFEQKNFLKLSVATALILALTFFYGQHRLNFTSDEETISVSVIQANIPQEEKWVESGWPRIMEKYLALSEQAASEKPDMIIWPETSFPGYLWRDMKLFDELKGFVERVQIPVLFGSILREQNLEKLKYDYYNAAIYLDQNGEVVGQYKKRHLVIFGEYIPFRNFFPFLGDFIPIADFSSGSEFTVFENPTKYANIFSVLICFEDTVMGLAGPFVHQGAQWLIDITNDAWFEDTKAPYMHLQSSVFRSVEHRRAMVRAANTGISCFINSQGQIYHLLTDKHGKATFVEGFTKADVQLRSDNSFFTKFGNIFAYICIGGIIVVIFIKVISAKW